MALLYAIIFGIAVFILAYHYIERFLDWLRFQSLGTRDYIVEKLGLMFIDVTPNRALLYLILSSLVPFLLFFLICLPKVLMGLFFGAIAAVVGWKLPKPVVNYFFARRIDRFNLQMVDGLGLLANALKSGLSVPQALDIVVEQMPNPMSQEFNLVLSENKVGVVLEEAFQNLAKRIDIEDVEMFVTSVNILKETGGNLAETFDTIVYVIRERIKAENKIKAMTAQGFYQGMVLLSVPVFLMAYFAMSEPGFMEPMFNDPKGWIMISIIVFLETIAYFVIKKAVTVDV